MNSLTTVLSSSLERRPRDPSPFPSRWRRGGGGALALGRPSVTRRHLHIGWRGDVAAREHQMVAAATSRTTVAAGGNAARGWRATPDSDDHYVYAVALPCTQTF